MDERSLDAGENGQGLCEDLLHLLPIHRESRREKITSPAWMRSEERYGVRRLEPPLRTLCDASSC